MFPIRSCLGRTSYCHDLELRQLGVKWFEPVDQYLKSTRAMKYALLFFALTFAFFFLYEVREGILVHPIQYGLVGLAQAIFYLLFLSLSEHIGFAAAYALSAGSCVLLLGFYVAFVLRSAKRGLGFSCGLATLYALRPDVQSPPHSQ